MGPRFVNVEYYPFFPQHLARPRRFNGATFCERGIHGNAQGIARTRPRFNGATFCERGILSVGRVWLLCVAGFQWGHVL